MPRTRKAFLLGVGLAACVLAATLIAGWLFVRALVREQIAQRDAEALHATTLMEQLDARGNNGEPLESEEQIGFDAAILASRLRGVMGIRFFDPVGRFADSFPATVLPKPLAPEALAAVRRLQPHSRFHREIPLSDVFIYRPEFATGNVARVPILEVTVPLHQRDGQKLSGVAQFIVEGQSIAAEYARLDGHLGGLGLLALAVATLLLVAMLWPVFRRVERLNRELAARSERLQRANEELALAARASALGAVSAHLMHGLKNPLASLSEFVQGRHANGSEPDKDEWQDALTAARRMQSLVEETMEVLGDARGEPGYRISVRELVEQMRKRVEPLVRKLGAQLVAEADGTDTLPSRTANLVRHILLNLLENAVQATPDGKTVELEIRREGDQLIARVRDEGPGFPAHLRKSLFLPCKSTKEGGSGIGLAIAKQLANHLGAKLELESSTAAGCIFVLGLPLEMAGNAPQAGTAQSVPS